MAKFQILAVLLLVAIVCINAIPVEEREAGSEGESSNAADGSERDARYWGRGGGWGRHGGGWGGGYGGGWGGGWGGRYGGYGGGWGGRYGGWGGGWGRRGGGWYY